MSVVTSWFAPSGAAKVLAKRATGHIELYTLTKRITEGDLNVYEISREIVATSQPGMLAAIGGAANAQAYVMTRTTIDESFSGAPSGVLSIVKAALRASDVYTARQALGTAPASAVEVGGVFSPAAALAVGKKMASASGAVAGGLGLGTLALIGAGLWLVLRKK